MCTDRWQWRPVPLRCREKLTAASTPHAWWSTLKTSVFGVSSSVPPLISPGGSLVGHPREKAELFNEHFDSKQCRDSVNLPPTCHRDPKLKSFAFRSRQVYRLLLDLDSHGGTDPLGFFPLFFKKLATTLAPKLSVVFRRLLKEGCFPRSWRCANVVPISKGPLSALVKDYRPISITPVLSKIYEKLIAGRLAVFFEREGILPDRQYAYRKGRGTCDALLDICSISQAALDRGEEVRLVQIDFSAAFDRVSHLGLLYKLQEVGVDGSLFNVIREFLTDRKQRVVVDGVSSGDIDIVSGVPQGSVLGPLLFLLYTSELSYILENTLIGYADDSTLIVTVPNPGHRLTISASLDRDLVRIANWCRSWGMKVNPSKTKSMVISRSRTIAPAFPNLELEGVLIDNVFELRVLGVILDHKLIFESHLRSVAASASQKLGILRKTYKVFSDPALIIKCFWSFLLPVLEYCSPVWSSAAACHLQLLDRVVRLANELCAGHIECDLEHRRLVASICMFYKLRDDCAHPLNSLLPNRRAPIRVTRLALSNHPWVVDPPQCRTVQFSRTFVPRFSELWNSLDASIFAGMKLDSFKSGVNRLLLNE